jgi:hypothetical protein
MALNVSEVRATPVDDDDKDGAETTNQRTEPPRRAASTEAISPIPPGGDITTTSGDEVCARGTKDNADLRLDKDDDNGLLLLNPLIDGAQTHSESTDNMIFIMVVWLLLLLCVVLKVEG